MASGDSGCSGCFGIVLILVLLVTVPPVGIALLVLVVLSWIFKGAGDAPRSDKDDGGERRRRPMVREPSKRDSKGGSESSRQIASSGASREDRERADSGSGCSGCIGLIFLLILIGFFDGLKRRPAGFAGLEVGKRRPKRCVFRSCPLAPFFRTPPFEPLFRDSFSRR